MTAFLAFVAAQRNGILVLAAAMIALALVANWTLWMFGWGRFRRDPAGPGASTKDSKLRFVLANFFVAIVNDFRHFLALVIAVLFASTLFGAMLPGLLKGSVNDVKDGLQAAAAALGGLMGSIIGYYFGESAATKKQTPGTKPSTSQEPPAEQVPPAVEAENEPGVTPAKEPPVESK